MTGRRKEVKRKEPMQRRIKTKVNTERQRAWGERMSER